MAWKQVSNTTAIDIKKESGKHFIGEYTGKKDITTEVGAQVIWQFIGEDGIPFGIYGFTNLNRCMEGLRPGTACRITYTGTQFVKTKWKPKGQDVHQVVVECDTDDVESAEISGTEE